MNDFVPKKKKREPFELQLTAMIDIFSMLVIFLIFGTVIGAAEMIFPPTVKVPRSASKESTESAPQVVIGESGVIVTTDGIVEIPLNDFFSTTPESTKKIEDLGTSLVAYVSKLPESKRKAGAVLNIIGDKELSYQQIFDVLKVFRAAGFESLLFIAQGEAPAKSGAR